MKTPDYRDLLRDELAARQLRKPTYSLRAFSRDLGVSPSHLSDLLILKKNLSEAKAGEILERLNWQEDSKRVFWLAFKKQTARNTKLRLGYERELAKWTTRKPGRSLDRSEFAVVSDWLCFALVELIRVRDFRPDKGWMSRRLGVAPSRIAAALAHLIKLGLIAESGGNYIVGEKFYSSGDIPSEAIRKNHHQHLHLASQALERQPFQERDFSGITMAIDPARIPEAKHMIRDFRRQLMEFLEGGDSRRVYRLNMQLFALDSAPRRNP